MVAKPFSQQDWQQQQTKWSADSGFVSGGRLLYSRAPFSNLDLAQQPRATGNRDDGQPPNLLVIQPPPNLNKPFLLTDWPTIYPRAWPLPPDIPPNLAIILPPGPPTPVVQPDGHDPGYIRRREPDWEEYRAEQRRLREAIIEVYEDATGKIASAEQILEKPRLPRTAARDLRPLIAKLRNIDAELAQARAAWQAWEADRLARQDEEDAIIILLLH